jgi:hypothetical protein
MLAGSSASYTEGIRVLEVALNSGNAPITMLQQIRATLRNQNGTVIGTSRVLLRLGKRHERIS